MLKQTLQWYNGGIIKLLSTSVCRHDIGQCLRDKHCLVVNKHRICPLVVRFMEEMYAVILFSFTHWELKLCLRDKHGLITLYEERFSLRNKSCLKILLAIKSDVTK